MVDTVCAADSQDSGIGQCHQTHIRFEEAEQSFVTVISSLKPQSEDVNCLLQCVLFS